GRTATSGPQRHCLDGLLGRPGCVRRGPGSGLRLHQHPVLVRDHQRSEGDPVDADDADQECRGCVSPPGRPTVGRARLADALRVDDGSRAIVESCGGTEIGGGYITGTVVQPCAPAMFTTPALGLDLEILDGGRPVARGEVFLVPPSIGLSTELLNYDNDEEYYDNVPK